MAERRGTIGCVKGAVRWSSAYPNLRLAALGLALCMVPHIALTDSSAFTQVLSIARRQILTSMPGAAQPLVSGMSTVALIGLAAARSLGIVLMVLAAGQALRDRRRRA